MSYTQSYSLYYKSSTLPAIKLVGKSIPEWSNSLWFLDLLTDPIPVKFPTWLPDSQVSRTHRTTQNEGVSSSCILYKLLYTIYYKNTLPTPFTIARRHRNQGRLELTTCMLFNIRTNTTTSNPNYLACFNTRLSTICVTKMSHIGKPQVNKTEFTFIM